MFGLSFGEIFVIGIIALIFIGPEELPVIARTIARFLNDLKHSASGLTDEIKKQASIDLQPKKMSEQIFDLATNAMLTKDAHAKNENLQNPSLTIQTGATVDAKSDQHVQNSFVDPHPQSITHGENQNEIRIEAEPLAVAVKPKIQNQGVTTQILPDKNEVSENE